MRKPQIWGDVGVSTINMANPSMKQSHFAVPMSKKVEVQAKLRTVARQIHFNSLDMDSISMDISWFRKGSPHVTNVTFDHEQLAELDVFLVSLVS